MTTISLAIVLQTAALVTTTNSQSYADARANTAETGKPLVVLVGADWCPACQTMKNSAMAQVARRGADQGFVRRSEYGSRKRPGAAVDAWRLDSAVGHVPRNPHRLEAGIAGRRAGPGHDRIVHQPRTRRDQGSRQRGERSQPPQQRRARVTVARRRKQRSATPPASESRSRRQCPAAPGSVCSFGIWHFRQAV